MQTSGAEHLERVTKIPEPSRAAAKGEIAAIPTYEGLWILARQMRDQFFWVYWEIQFRSLRFFIYNKRPLARSLIKNSAGSKIGIP